MAELEAFLFTIAERMGVSSLKRLLSEVIAREFYPLLPGGLDDEH